MMKLSRLLASTSAPALALAVCTPAIAGEVTGTVIDASETIALQSAEVRIVELGRAAVTQRDGSFFFADVPEGKYTLEFRYIGAQTERRTVTVPASGPVRIDVALGGVSGVAAADILVIGQAANQASALSRKRASDTVSDTLTRDAIGQFPDQNVAESLRRLPGINILDDQGEGRFVSVRGLNPNLNSTSINGVRLPSPEQDERQVALDVVSSDIIESIEVKKSLTPDMDADTIGASVEIATTSAFARKKDILTIKAEGSYNDFADHISPKGSIDFTRRISDNVGLSGGISYYKRKFETDNIEADDWSEDDGLIYAEEVQYRDYDVERERISATLNFDFRMGDTTELYLRGLYSQFDDQEFRRRTTFKFDEAPSSGSGTTVVFDDADGEIELERDIKDRFESQKIRSLVFGGDTDTGEWKAKYSVSWAKSSETEHDSLDPTTFDHKFEGEGLVVAVDQIDSRTPLYSVSGNTADFFNPGAYELDDIELTHLSNSVDEEYAAVLDLGREFYTDSGTITVQAGFKGRWRDKSYDKTVEFYENDALTLADVLGEQTYRITDISPVTSYRGSTDYFFANRGDFELNEVDSQFDSAADDYSVSEDIMAGYLLARYDSPTLRVIGGVRYEHTSDDISANLVTLVEEDGTLPDGTTASDDTVLVSPVMFKKDYDHWLPSLNIRWEAQPDLIVRAAGYRSLVRPNLSKLAPRFRVEEADDGEREGEFGNPDLKPYEAWNADLSLEYYMTSNGAISAAFFYKDIKNFIVDTVREDGVYNGIAFNEATIPINGESAEVWGIELSFAQAFTMLPSPFDGLLVQANYTYTDASGMVPNDGDPTDLRKIALPSTSKHTANITLGYEKGPISLRVSGTYRDKYLDELGDEAEVDRYVDDHFQLDLSAKYRINKQIQLFYEWVNINDAKYFAYNNFGGRQNLYQYERYNWTMKFGARLSF
ncbi:MAG: TonB-dependent receptor [Novosphingobium sp.]